MSEIVAEGIIEARRLQQFIDTLTPMVSEAKVHWNDDGLTVRVVDPANVAMLAPLELGIRAFEHYEAPGSATVGLSITRLDDRIDHADADQLIELAVDMETRRLRIEYGRAELTLGLINPESIRSEPNIPDLELPNHMVLSGEQFDDAVQITDMVSDHVDIVVDADAERLTFTSEGDTDDATVDYGLADLIDAEFVTDTLSIYSLDYVEEFVSAIPSDSEVELELADEMPMRLSWDACDGHLSATGTLAPRIQKR